MQPQDATWATTSGLSGFCLSTTNGLKTLQKGTGKAEGPTVGLLFHELVTGLNWSSPA